MYAFLFKCFLTNGWKSGLQVFHDHRNTALLWSSSVSTLCIWWHWENNLHILFTPINKHQHQAICNAEASYVKGPLMNCPASAHTENIPEIPCLFTAYGPIKLSVGGRGFLRALNSSCHKRLSRQDTGSGSLLPFLLYFSCAQQKYEISHAISYCTPEAKQKQT